MCEVLPNMRGMPVVCAPACHHSSCQFFDEQFNFLEMYYTFNVKKFDQSGLTRSYASQVDIPLVEVIISSAANY